MYLHITYISHLTNIFVGVQNIKVVTWFFNKDTHKIVSSFFSFVFSQIRIFGFLEAFQREKRS
jgi:hypothetical protein